MKKYEIYKVVNKINGTVYIGFTSKGIETRLHKHNTNAMYGLDSFFYRAIRKYGISEFTYESIDYSFNECEIKEKEKYWIKYYDSYANGYNMTLGGDGGNTIGKLSPEKYDEYINIKRMHATGSKNNNFSGLSDDDIVNFGVDFFISTKFKWSHSRWIKDYCRVYNIPQSFSKCRFDGLGSREFKRLVLSKIHEMGYVDITEIKYIKSDAHKKKLSDFNIGKKWYHNDDTSQNKQLREHDVSDGWKIGRKKYNK